MVVLRHIVAILLGFAVATFVGTLVGCLSFAGMRLAETWSISSTHPTVLDFVTIVIFMAFIFFPMTALSAALPSLVLILLTERHDLRTIKVHALAGGCVGLACLLFFRFFFDLGDWFAGLFLSVSLAGVLAGMVYWAIAGRNAGRWREQSIGGRQVATPDAGATKR